MILAGRRLLLCADDGALLRSDGDAVDMIGEAFDADVEAIVIPISRLGAGFFDLSTRIAGEVIQKLVNYRYRTVFLGDIAQPLQGSKALRDFVRESNRGTMVWFLPDLATLEHRLRETKFL